jgi:hypothetical protein
MVLRLVYTIFLGLLLATFIGVGIAAFYKTPKQPDPYYGPPVVSPEPNATETAKMDKYYEDDRMRWDEHNKKQRVYDRNVAAIAMGAAVLYLILGLILANRILLLSDGLLFGSIFTLIYSIARGFNSDNELVRFGIVSVGLAIAIVLGYIKFVKPDSKK